jgi:ABC-type sugar transport system ATPase subunit
MPAITLKNISLQLGLKNQSFCLTDISLQIKQGEFVAIVGPSGAGKSTLLRAIAGLEQLTLGEIYFDDRRVDQLAAAKRQVALVFQHCCLFPHLNIAQNLALALTIQGQAKKIIKQQVQDIAEVLRLQDFLSQYPHQLSGGQQQRVAIGRAILSQSQVMLYDEPLSNLDQGLRYSLRQEIKALHQRQSATSLFVTHDQHEALAIADTLVVMNNGKVLQVGKPQDLVNKPTSLFVAQFFNSHGLNCLPAQVQEKGLKVGENRFIACQMPLNFIDKVVMLAIPAAKLTVHKQRGWAAKILRIEPGLAHHVLVVSFEDMSLELRVNTTTFDWQIDQQIFLSAKRTDLWLFDERGQRIELDFE